MKLVLAIVQGEDAGQTVQALSAAGIPVTRFASSGGFLQQASTLYTIDWTSGLALTGVGTCTGVAG